MKPNLPDYTDVFEKLNKNNVRYVVIGSFACALQGYVRAIGDLDVAISSRPDEANYSIAVLASAGFIPSILIPVTMLTVLRLFDHSRREVNAVVRPYVPFAELFERATNIAIGETPVRVASVEDLIRAKQTASQPKDLEDIKHLTELCVHERC